MTWQHPVQCDQKGKERTVNFVKHQEIRIIGGQWKRSKLAVANQPGLRPTPDRVRETLFNWLGQDLTGKRCMDVFAGTGVLGFEAASRFAQTVLLVEKNAVLVAQIQQLKDKLKASAVNVVQGDGIAALRRCLPGSLDLIFLDPPFDSNLLETALPLAACAVSTNGSIYLESSLRWSDDRLAPIDLQLHRYLKARAVHAHVLISVHPDPFRVHSLRAANR